ncbi:MAG: hypothetical protein HY390_03920 [Deltaproteobacteria bacterium]|nr:hypothetical protein [Deltaproteobacteria bacterium]
MKTTLTKKIALTMVVSIILGTNFSYGENTYNFYFYSDEEKKAGAKENEPAAANAENSGSTTMTQAHPSESELNDEKIKRLADELAKKLNVPTTPAAPITPSATVSATAAPETTSPESNFIAHDARKPSPDPEYSFISDEKYLMFGAGYNKLWRGHAALNDFSVRLKLFPLLSFEIASPVRDMDFDLYRLAAHAEFRLTQRWGVFLGGGAYFDNDRPSYLRDHDYFGSVGTKLNLSERLAILLSAQRLEEPKGPANNISDERHYYNVNKDSIKRYFEQSTVSYLAQLTFGF